MAFNDTRALWTPGRVHVENEIETEFNAGVTSLANGAVQRADFAPDARLPPWVFAMGRSRTGVEFMAHGIPLAAATLVDSLWLPRNMTLNLHALHVHVERNSLQPFGYTVTGAIRLVYRDGTTSAIFGDATAAGGTQRTTGINNYGGAVSSGRGSKIEFYMYGAPAPDGLRYVRVRGVVIAAARWTRAD